MTQAELKYSKRVGDNEEITIEQCDDGVYLTVDMYHGDRCKLREFLYTNDAKTGVFWIYDRRIIGPSTVDGYYAKVNRDATFPVGIQVRLLGASAIEPRLE